MRVSYTDRRPRSYSSQSWPRFPMHTDCIRSEKLTIVWKDTVTVQTTRIRESVHWQLKMLPRSVVILYCLELREDFPFRNSSLTLVGRIIYVLTRFVMTSNHISAALSLYVVGIVRNLWMIRQDSDLRNSLLSGESTQTLRQPYDLTAITRVSLVALLHSPKQTIDAFDR